MHVVFLSPVGTLGGAERVLLTSIAAIRQTNPRVRLSVVVAGAGPLFQAIEQLGVKPIYAPMPAALSALSESAARRAGIGQLFGRLATLGKAGWDYPARLGKLLSDLRPDVLHSNGVKMHLLAAALRPRGTAVVWHLHDFVGLRSLTPWLLRLGCRKVTALANSRAVADDARRVLPGLKVRVVFNAIDAAFFADSPQERASLDQLAGLPEAGPGTVRVGLVATYALWKGHQVFLEAAARLSLDQTIPPVRFFIVGGPVYQTSAQRSEAELRSLAEGLGIGSRVGFIGFQKEIAPIYRAMDVVVHASTQPEPFGLTIAEAMACGCAVAVSRAGGASELCTPDHDCIGTAPGDSSGLASGMRRLIVNPALRRKLGEHARLTARSRFHPDRFGSQLLGAYAEALKKNAVESRSTMGVT